MVVSAFLFLSRTKQSNKPTRSKFRQAKRPRAQTDKKKKKNQKRKPERIICAQNEENPEKVIIKMKKMSSRR